MGLDLGRPALRLAASLVLQLLFALSFGFFLFQTQLFRLSLLLFTGLAVGPYDQYVYRFSFENQQEISMDDRGTLYTQKGGYTMTGDFSGVLDLLNGWF